MVHIITLFSWLSKHHVGFGFRGSYPDELFRPDPIESMRDNIERLIISKLTGECEELIQTN